MRLLQWFPAEGEYALSKNTAFTKQLLSIEAPPSPLSSRAKPRDLQFSGPLLEMFFIPFGGPMAHDSSVEKHFRDSGLE
jgi:hypothetical protein